MIKTPEIIWLTPEFEDRHTIVWQSNQPNDPENEVAYVREDAICKYADGEMLLKAVKLAYRKHWMDDDSIGWSELGDTLGNVLAEAMGDDDFCKWLERTRKKIESDNQELPSQFR